ncbi:Beta-fructofuranosidase, insoluble isoenzyme like [Actinidia chinensis var. chinensis]|uniref:Beta-fructofuranosidase, insoluble isoenzyme like n=1 Tax=Actinidia chinensis var. chinensis TaxID=1590841 RepID=A0A2R6Q310_ACTCC|nr:Beta-fructofuranosidase, insoluble isoenzyme like [Actinidia chinensis var. chinensis]
MGIDEFADPNGPMYYKGAYHLFYQYNPYEAVWGNILWAHSISYDLVNWVHLDHAINPTDPFDINGCWSGSTTILPGEKPAILYTGADTNNHQVQNLVVPKNLSDPLLREWVKSAYNPLLSPVDGIDPNFFRDPTTAWQGPDKIWRVIVGSQINGHGTAILYKSEDFVKWTRSENPLHSSNKTNMWECPDFYPVDTSMTGRGTKHVLKASFNDRDYYIMGDYDPRTDRYVVETNFMDSALKLRYDYGKFYASKTFYDSAKRRRVLWGWIQESDSKSDDIKKGWSGLQSIPRTILLGKSERQLIQWPIEEIKQLRTNEANIHDIELKGGDVLEVVGITASQADVEVSFDLPSLNEAESMDQSSVDPQLLCSQKQAYVKGIVGPFGLLVLGSKDLTEQTAIFFRILKTHGKYVVLMCSDQSRSSLREEVDKTTYGAFVDVDPQSETISLRSLIDHSIVESFGGEGVTCITARVYPKLAVDKGTHLYAFNNGTQSVKISRLSAWSMKQAQILPIQKRRRPLFN